MDTKTELHSILLVIKSKLDEGTLPMHPICHLVEEEAEDRRLPIWAYYSLEEELKSLMGGLLFPVRESPDVSPQHSYVTHYRTPAMWAANHPYGAARRRLLADLIEQTK